MTGNLPARTRAVAAARDLATLLGMVWERERGRIAYQAAMDPQDMRGYPAWELLPQSMRERWCALARKLTADLFYCNLCLAEFNSSIWGIEMRWENPARREVVMSLSEFDEMERTHGSAHRLRDCNGQTIHLYACTLVAGEPRCEAHRQHRPLCTY